MSFNPWRIPVLLFFMFLFFLMLALNTGSQLSTYIMEFNLLSLSSTEFSMAVIFDLVSVSFAFVVSLISFCVFMFSVYYMDGDPFYNRFTWLLFLFVTSMMLLIFSGSLFFLLLGWDGLGLSSFALIIYYSSSESLKAGYLTLLINRLGDCVMVMTMFLFIMVGYFSLYHISLELSLVVVLMGISSLTKSAQYPFSSWLPAAMAAPTPVSALVHSSTLVTAGVYLLIRLGMGFHLPFSFLSILMLLSSITCLLGGWAAMYENDLKKIIALSTLSQLGVMMFSVSMNLVDLALFHLYVHAMFKALLFIGAGTVLMMSFGAQDIRLLGGILKSCPFTSVFFVISSLCLAGAPFTSGFFSKHLILEKMLTGQSITILSLVFMLIGSVTTAAYSFRLLKIVFGSPTLLSVCLPMSSKSFLFYIPMLILGFMGVSGGFLFSSVNMTFVDTAFIPPLLSVSLNMILFIGAIIGIYFTMGSSSFLLSSMFFLSPTCYSLSKVISSISVYTLKLDSGWLEPGVYLNYLLPNSFNYVYHFALWPVFSKSTLMKAFLVFISVAYTFL